MIFGGLFLAFSYLLLTNNLFFKFSVPYRYNGQEEEEGIETMVLVSFAKYPNLIRNKIRLVGLRNWVICVK